MKFLRNLLDDLWEKRLWPIALALVVALVAVPLLLAKGDGDTAASVPLPAASKLGPLASSTPAVDIVQPDSASRLLPLSKHNPFAQQHLPQVAKPADAATKGTDTSAPAGGAGGAGGSAGPGTGGASVGPVAPAQTFDVASLDIRFGRADSKQERRNLPRLAPLPSAGNAVVIYLGLLKDGHTAVFLISSDAHAEGDGSCHPKKANCETVHMKAGDSEFFDVTTASGAIVQYELDLLHVRVTKTTDPAVAKAAYVRASRSGKSLLRKFLRRTGQNSVGNIRYDARLGRLVLFHPPSAVWGHVLTPGNAAAGSPSPLAAAVGHAQR